jgi:site-specific recombinase XerD
MGGWIDPGEAATGFARWLAGQPLAERSRREYARNVRAFCDWLAVSADRDGWGADPLADPLARDHAARDYKRWLKVERRAAPASVNLALASLDALYRQRGLGRPNVRREKPVQAAPRALAPVEQRRLLREAERASPRDRALVVLLLFTGLRLGEALALDVEDVRLMARAGVVVVRSGKGDLQREVPANALVRQALEEWIKGRRPAEPTQRALFVSRTGGRLSARAADAALRQLAGRAGLRLSAHVLRHTCLTGLVRAGNDLVLVAELAGHRRLETTRRYALPSQADRQRALEDLAIDF